MFYTPAISRREQQGVNGFDIVRAHQQELPFDLLTGHFQLTQDINKLPVAASATSKLARSPMVMGVLLQNRYTVMWNVVI